MRLLSPGLVCGVMSSRGAFGPGTVLRLYDTPTFLMGRVYLLGVLLVVWGHLSGKAGHYRCGEGCSHGDA